MPVQENVDDDDDDEEEQDDNEDDVGENKGVS
jgi:hypothetical protein